MFRKIMLKATKEITKWIEIQKMSLRMIYLNFAMAKDYKTELKMFTITVFL